MAKHARLPMLLLCSALVGVPLLLELLLAEPARRHAPGLALLLEWPFDFAWALLAMCACALQAWRTHRQEAGSRTVAVFKGAFLGACCYIGALMLVTQAHLWSAGRG